MDRTLYDTLQHSPNISSKDPFKDLLSAILARGLYDLIDENIVERRSALTWFRSNNEKYVFSFLNVCLFLNVCPKRIRKLIKNKDFVLYFREDSLRYITTRKSPVKKKLSFTLYEDGTMNRL